MNDRDHDILVALAVKMEVVHSDIKKLEEAVIGVQEYCIRRGEMCGVIHASKTDNAWFKWAVGLILGVVLASAGLAIEAKLQASSLSDKFDSTIFKYLPPD